MSVQVQQSIFSELADFLVSQPSLEELAAYKVTTGVQMHIDSLLEKNAEGQLSAEERLELEKILAVSHVMTLAKTKAKLKLA
jgi:ATP-dependent RNA circularization protein (DNA/RNA ligase family)